MLRSNLFLLSFLITAVVLTTGEDAINSNKNKDATNSNRSNREDTVFSNLSSPEWPNFFSPMIGFFPFFDNSFFNSAADLGPTSSEPTQRLKFPAFGSFSSGSSGAPQVSFDLPKCLMTIDLSSVSKNSNVKVDLVKQSIHVTVSSKGSQSEQNENRTFLYKKFGSSYSDVWYSIPHQCGIESSKIQKSFDESTKIISLSFPHNKTEKEEKEEKDGQQIQNHKEVSDRRDQNDLFGFHPLETNNLNLDALMRSFSPRLNGLLINEIEADKTETTGNNKNNNQDAENDSKNVYTITEL